MVVFCRSSVLASSLLMFFVLMLSVSFGVLGGGSILVEFSLGEVSLFDVSFPVVLDWMSVSFSLTVCMISFFVILFSTSYMSGEKNMSRFIWLVMLFVLSMNFLIFVPSVLGLILGWDGLGVVSFLLVVYYQNFKSLGAGLVTALMNRVGDAFLLLGIVLMSFSGHWCIISHEMWGYGAILFNIFIIVVSMTKSAQIPFSYWLPAAMNAPTPVSALVHSSTLVTAGVYLLIRVSSGIGLTGGSSLLLLWVSLFTMNMAGFSACFEVDFKKVIALSTLSQLGVMMFSISVGSFVLSFFHLMSHAIFKALMFVSAGRVIHGSSDSQEVRSISGLWLSMPLTSGCLVLASMSLMGLPFLSGFYSKDSVVEMYLVGELNGFVAVLVLGAMFSTVAYSLRTILCCVMGKPGNSAVECESQSGYEVVPSLGLGLGAIVGGYSLQCFLFNFESVFVLEWPYKILLSSVILMAGLGSLVYLWWGSAAMVAMSKLKGFVYYFFCSMWFLSYVASSGNMIGLSSSSVLAKDVDVGWNEKIYGGVGVFNYLRSWSSLLFSESSGFILGRYFLGFVVFFFLVFVIWS